MSTNSPLQGVKVLMLLDNNFKSDARVEKEAKTLIRHGASVTIVCLTDNNLPKTEVRDDYSISRTIGHAYNAPLRKGYTEFVNHTVKEILERDFDVLHCHDFYMLSIGSVVKKAKPQIKLIYDAHEYLKGWPFYKTSTGLNKFKGRLVWNKLVKKEHDEIQTADGVLTITDGIARQLQSNNQLQSLPTVLGNYPIPQELKTEEGYFHTKYKVAASTKFLAHIGTIYHSDEQIQKLYEAVKNTDNLAIVFIGNRPRFFDLEKLAKQDKTLDNKVFFHDYPDDQQAAINLLSAADIGLLHIIDRWEAHRIGFSNRFVEYIMSGIPVVATPQEFTMDIQKKFNCSSFYSCDSQEELSNALQEMIANYEALKAGAQQARIALDWDKESIKLVNLYTSMV